jgi:hypothetical protein
LSHSSIVPPLPGRTKSVNTYSGGGPALMCQQGGINSVGLNGLRPLSLPPLSAAGHIKEQS